MSPRSEGGRWGGSDKRESYYSCLSLSLSGSQWARHDKLTPIHLLNADNGVETN